MPLSVQATQMHAQQVPLHTPPLSPEGIAACCLNALANAGVTSLPPVAHVGQSGSDLTDPHLPPRPWLCAGLLQLQKKINRERNVVNWFQRNI